MTPEEQLRAMHLYRAQLLKQRWEAQVCAFDAEIALIDATIAEIERATGSRTVALH